MRLVVAVVAFGLFACGQTESSATPAEQHLLPNDPGPLDALARRFARLRERMRERGAREVRGPARYFALESDGISVVVDLPVDTCTTFVALGGGAARDLVVSVYDRDGGEVVRDDVQSEGGLVHVCPSVPPDQARTETFYLTLESRAGAGAILVAQFESARDAQPHFDGLFANVLVPDVPLREVEALLARSRSTLRSRGFLPVAPATYDAVSEGGVVRHTLVVREERCYAIVARASAGVRDVDVSLFDADGVEVGRDLRGDAEPVLEHCPTAAGSYRVDARAFTGAGAIGLLLLEGPAAPQARNALATEAPAAAPASENGARLLRDAVESLTTRGYQAASTVANSIQTSPGEVRGHEVVFEAGCSVVVGAASSEEMDLDLYLSDPNAHRELDEDTGMQSVARVSACVTERTPLRVTVKTYGNSASYDLVMLRAPDAIREISSLRLDEAEASFRARAYQSVSQTRFALEEGEHRSVPIVMDRAGCFALAVAGGDGVDDVDMFLRDAAGHLVARESGPASYAAVARCTTAPETLNLELVMYRGAGSVVLDRLEDTP